MHIIIINVRCIFFRYIDFKSMMSEKLSIFLCIFKLKREEYLIYFKTKKK